MGRRSGNLDDKDAESLMNIQMAPSDFWSYQQYIAEQVRRLLLMAEGGQLVIRGTDDKVSSQVIAQAQSVISDLKIIQRGFVELGDALVAILQREIA
jgi:hypothetical protein